MSLLTGLLCVAGGMVFAFAIVIGLQMYAKKWFLRGLAANDSSEADPMEKRIFDVKLADAENLITEEYDIVLGHEVVQFLQTLTMNGFMLNYQDFMDDVREAIELKKANFPNGTNTVILRRVVINPDQTGTYVLEGISNPNTKSVFA